MIVPPIRISRSRVIRILLLCLVFAIPVFYSFIRSASAQISGAWVRNWSDLYLAMQFGGDITLVEDAIYGQGEGEHAQSSLEVPAGITVNLNLNGHKINRNSTSYPGGSFIIRVWGNLTVSGSGNIQNIWNEAVNGGGVIVKEGGTFTMNGGTIIDCKARNGAGVYVEDGTFVMNGGLITSNRATVSGGGVMVTGSSARFIMNDGKILSNYSTQYGGGVSVFYGAFEMKGGTIEANYADTNPVKKGGGVYLDNASFTMSGGTIIRSVSGESGGGVYALNSSLTLSGGTITHNFAADYGGGVFASGGGTFIMSAGTISENGVSHNNGSGGGVYVGENNSFTMSGGSIRKNSLSGGGGGIYLGDSTSSFTMDNASASVSGNTANYGGGVCVGRGTFTMSAGSVSGNSASINGGGVYVVGSGVFKLSGSPDISGNTKNDSPNNVYLGDKNITVIGNMNNTVSVGVRMSQPGVFTDTASGNTGWNIKEKFKSDDPSYGVGKNNNGQLFLGKIYTLTYSGNGNTEGSVPYEPVEYLSGTKVTVPGNIGKLLRTGYIFGGWNTRADGTGTPYKENDPLTINGNITLYARWIEKVKLPVISPNGGTYTEAQDVVITCGTEGAVIHYTVDGTEPTAESSIFNSPVNISENLTLKAIAVKEGMADSDIAEAVFTIEAVPTETETVTPKPTKTVTIEPTETETATPGPSETPTPDPSKTVTIEPSKTVTIEPSETASPEPSETPTPEPSEPASPQPSETASPEPSETASPEPSETASPEPSETASPQPSEPVSPEPSETASPQPSETASPEPSEPVSPETMVLTVKFVFLKGNGNRGVPFDVKDTKLYPSIIIRDGRKDVSQTDSLTLEISAGAKEKSIPATFSKKVSDLAPGKYSVSISGLPETVDIEDYGEDSAKYKLSAKAEINTQDGNTVIVVYLIFKDRYAPEEPVVYVLPEDDIGAYSLRADGTKEYLLFHTYDICMSWLGKEELCKGPEKCFHKDGK